MQFHSFTLLENTEAMSQLKLRNFIILYFISYATAAHSPPLHLVLYIISVLNLWHNYLQGISERVKKRFCHKNYC